MPRRRDLGLFSPPGDDYEQFDGGNRIDPSPFPSRDAGCPATPGNPSLKGPVRSSSTAKACSSLPVRSTTRLGPRAKRSVA